MKDLPPKLYKRLFTSFETYQRLGGILCFVPAVCQGNYVVEAVAMKLTATRLTDKIQLKALERFNDTKVCLFSVDSKRLDTLKTLHE
jgi:hypothetical protein